MATNNKTAPCKDCPNRVSGCHSRCEKYIAFADAREIELNRRQTQKWLNHLSYTKPIRR